MYYCHTRYYVPKWLRWLNGDNVEYLDTNDFAGINLFVYCGNNPVIAADPDGTMHWGWKLAIGIGVIALLAVATVATGGAAAVVLGAVAVGALSGGVIEGTNAFINSNGDADATMNAFLGGVIAGAGVGAAFGLGVVAGAGVMMGTAMTIGGVGITGSSAFLIGTGVSFLSGMGGYAAKTIDNSTEKFSLKEMLIDGGRNAIKGATSVGVGYIIGYGGFSNLTPDTLFKSKVANVIAKSFTKTMFLSGVNSGINKMFEGCLN